MAQGGEQPASVGRQRLDKWLFFARIAKSRAIAQKWLSDGLVRVNGATVSQPSHAVHSGDKIEILSWRGIRLQGRLYQVKLPGSRRGPYEEAKLLYTDLGTTERDG